MIDEISDLLRLEERDGDENPPTVRRQREGFMIDVHVLDRPGVLDCRFAMRDQPGQVLHSLQARRRAGVALPREAELVFLDAEIVQLARVVGIF